MVDSYSETDYSESIQKRACRIILGVDYVSYNLALSVCKYQTLEVRGHNICVDFATALASHPQYQDWLPLKNPVDCFLRQKVKYQQYFCKTQIFHNSAIPYFINLLNTTTHI